MSYQQCDGTCPTKADTICQVCRRHIHASCDWQQGRCPHLAAPLAFYAASVADGKWHTGCDHRIGFSLPAWVRKFVMWRRK